LALRLEGLWKTLPKKEGQRVRDIPQLVRPPRRVVRRVTSNVHPAVVEQPVPNEATGALMVH
jgi:hypothetical protein